MRPRGENGSARREYTRCILPFHFECACIILFYSCLAANVLSLISTLAELFWTKGKLFPFYCRGKGVLQHIVFDPIRKTFFPMDHQGNVDETVSFPTIWSLMYAKYNQKFSIKSVLYVFGINIRTIERHRE